MSKKLDPALQHHFNSILFQAKVDLFRLLHQKSDDPDSMTENEVDILYKLSHEPEIQARLEASMKARNEIERAAIANACLGDGLKGMP